MNSFNILRELHELISKQNLPGIYDDVKKAAEETLNILEKDKIILSKFNKEFHSLKPLLEFIIKKTNPQNKKNIKNQEYIKHISLLSYYLKDVLSVLKNQYKTQTISELEKAIFESKSESDIFEFTATLLSTLIDEGHSIEEMFSIAYEIFIDNKSKKSYSFEDNFKFMKRIIQHSDNEYEIIFRLDGCKKSDLIPARIVNVHFEREPIIKEPDEIVKSFLCLRNLFFNSGN